MNRNRCFSREFLSFTIAGCSVLGLLACGGPKKHKVALPAPVTNDLAVGGGEPALVGRWLFVVADIRMEETFNSQLQKNEKVSQGEEVFFDYDSSLVFDQTGDEGQFKETMTNIRKSPDDSDVQIGSEQKCIYELRADKTELAFECDENYPSAIEQPANWYKKQN